MEQLGLPAERLTGRECRRLEPMLAPSVRGGLLAAADGSIDPRRLDRRAAGRASSGWACALDPRTA